MKTSLIAPFHHPLVHSLVHPAAHWRREAFTRVHVSSAPVLPGPPAQCTVGVCYRRVKRSREPPYPKTTRRFYGRRHYVVQRGVVWGELGCLLFKAGCRVGVGGAEGASAKAAGICARINTGRGAGAEAS